MKMKKTMVAYAVLVSAFAVHPQLSAQAPPANPGTPPKMLIILREEMKPGKGTAHEKLEAGYVSAFRRAKAGSYYLAVSSVTGPDVVLFLEAQDSFAGIEKARKEVEGNPALQAELGQLDEQDGELRTGGENMIARLREDMSYRSGSLDATKARYFEVLTVRVKLGREEEYTGAVKGFIAGEEKANVDQPWACYEVAQGAPFPTYIFFIPMRSLKEADTDYDKAIRAAMGEENWKKVIQNFSDATQREESNLFAVSQKMSYVSKEFAAGDPEFWTPKPKATAKAPAKAPATPPAKKEPEKPAKKQG